MKKLRLLLILVPVMATAAPWWLKGSNAKPDDFLDPEIAFKPSARFDGEAIRVSWTIADGYYLYRSRIKIEAESPGLTVDPINFSHGIIKKDPYLGTQEIFKSSAEAAVRYERHDAGAHPLQVRVTYQGCAEAGLCYPPIVKVLFPSPGTAATSPSPTAVNAAPAEHSWVGLAIGAGGLAFLLAGFVLRRGRQLDFPRP